MATAFHEGGDIDARSTAALARRLVDDGSQGLVVAGTTGESPTLDDHEKIALLEAVVDEVGDETTIILGSGSNDTRHSVELTRAAADAGADAGLVVTPYYNRPNAAGLKAHFTAIAEGSPDLPLILYNIPSRVGINMEPDFLAELAQVPNIVAVKQANDEQLQAIPGLDLLAGNDVGFLRVLELGGAGGILVASHLAGGRMRQMWDSAQAGDLEQARQTDLELAPLYSAMGVTINPIPVKAALEMVGICSATMRLPMVEATPEEKEEIRTLLSQAGIDLPERGTL